MKKLAHLINIGHIMSGTDKYVIPYIDNSSPIHITRKHTVETYRSQQRKAKQRRKKHNL